VDVDQFERATAEIADQAVGPVDPRHDPVGAELRFTLARQHVDLGAAQALRLGDELLAVRGIAARGGGDRPHALDAHRVAQRAEPGERRQRLIDRVLGQKAGRMHLATEAAQGLLVEQRGRAAGEPLVDDETDRVGADIDDGDRRAGVEAALRGGVSLRRARADE
jgi:hypothetical protein